MFLHLSDATKNLAQSINYEIKRKQSEFERLTQWILGFQRFLPKIRFKIENGFRF